MLNTLHTFALQPWEGGKKEINKNNLQSLNVMYGSVVLIIQWWTHTMSL